MNWSRASTLATVLDQFFRAKRQGEAAAVNAAERSVPVTIVPDERSNTLLITGTKEGFDVIAAGQVRAGEQLVDVQQMARGGTLTTILEPLFEGQLAGIPPGSSCIANAYTSNYDELHAAGISTTRWVYLHVIDAVGLVHAMILRLQALLLPVQTLVLTGH